MGDPEDTQELNLDPSVELTQRLKRHLATDVALYDLQLEPGASEIEGEPNVLGVETRDGHTLFIEVKS